jgi:hypothetical protein
LHAAAVLSKKELAELSKKEGVLGLIGENYSEGESFPQPSPDEASKSVEET